MTPFTTQRMQRFSVLVLVLFALLKVACPARDGDIQSLWPTPFFQDVFVDKPGALTTQELQDLASLAHRLSNVLPGRADIHHLGVWKSPTDLQLAEVKAYKDLAAFIQRAVAQYVLSTLDEKAFPRAAENEFGSLMHRFGKDILRVEVKSLWCTVTRPDDMIMPHVQPGHKLSGMILVEAPPEPVPPATLTLQDPRPQVFIHDWEGFMEFGNQLHIQPRFGEIVIFPAWIMAGATKQLGVPPEHLRPSATSSDSPENFTGPFEGLTNGRVRRVAYHFNADFYLDVPRNADSNMDAPGRAPRSDPVRAAPDMPGGQAQAAPPDENDPSDPPEDLGEVEEL